MIDKIIFVCFSLLLLGFFILEAVCVYVLWFLPIHDISKNLPLFCSLVGWTVKIVSVFGEAASLLKG